MGNCVASAKSTRLPVVQDRKKSSENRINVVKAILVGSSGVGKSSLLRRLVDEPFDPSLITTIGVDFKVGLTVSLQLSWRVTFLLCPAIINDLSFLHCSLPHCFCTRAVNLHSYPLLGLSGDYHEETRPRIGDGLQSTNLGHRWTGQLTLLYR